MCVQFAKQIVDGAPLGTAPDHLPEGIEHVGVYVTHENDALVVPSSGEPLLLCVELCFHIVMPEFEAVPLYVFHRTPDQCKVPPADVP